MPKTTSTSPGGRAAKRSPCNGLIRKIHAMKRELALDEDSYRDFLERVTGKRSCALLNMAGLEAVKNELLRLGAGRKHRAMPHRAGARRMATGRQASKIRALWLSLYHLGELQSPAESALALFVMRTAGIEAIEWLGPADADKTIRALRGWCDRVGFKQPAARRVAEIDTAREMAGIPRGGHGFAAKVVLIELQWNRLCAAGILGDAQSAGLDQWLERYGTGKRELLASHSTDEAIELLGRRLRRLKAEAADHG